MTRLSMPSRTPKTIAAEVLRLKSMTEEVTQQATLTSAADTQHATMWLFEGLNVTSSKTMAEGTKANTSGRVIGLLGG